MDGIRIRGARLVYRHTEFEVVPLTMDYVDFTGSGIVTENRGFKKQPVEVKPNYFIDGDIIEFHDAAREAADEGEPPVISRRCFRVGHGGSTLTPVARGSWLS